MLGYFPSKVVLPGSGSFMGTSPFTPDTGHSRDAHFDRLILMVVDAMRSDFMFLHTSNMTFLHDIIQNGTAIPFTAYSNPPTVTLPRLKGITSGTAPSFLDAILNVADGHDTSQSSLGDSWVHQLSRAGKRIHFYGDDTWLKLFPNTFAAQDGTNSFFVSDFTEVDNNVTRHLDQELASPSASQAPQWDALILHYLGLDHIGHKGGPESVFMKPKQAEMDAVLERLYRHANSPSGEKTLIVLMGDHGMNEIGNHGGSSAGETSPGLVFISPLFRSLLPGSGTSSPLPQNKHFSYHDKISQIDLVPTLAALLNFPIPINSLGVLISKFLPLWTPRGQMSVLRENYRQLRQLYVAKFGDLGVAAVDDACSSVPAAYAALHSLQAELASVATDYNYKRMYTGIASSILAAVLACAWIRHYSFLAFAALYSLHFYGSSLIEEEHQIWWFFCVSAFALFVVKNHVSWLSCFLLALGLRFVRGWNITGQKYLETASLATTLLQYPSLMWVLVVITFIATSFMVYQQGSIRECAKFEKPKPDAPLDPRINVGCLILVSSVLALLFAFKMCQFCNDGKVIPFWLRPFASLVLSYYNLALPLDSPVPPQYKLQLQAINVSLSQMATYGFAALLVVRFRKLSAIRHAFITDLVNITTLFLIHQTRIENIPMFLAFFLVKWSFARLLADTLRTQRVLAVSVFTLCMQNVSFFAMGNTNSIASVDLSNAYNGVKAYTVQLVGLLTFVSAYAAPIFWSLSSLQLLFELPILAPQATETGVPVRDTFLSRSKLLLAFYSISTVNLICSCTNFRFHLFVWSVFSPKLLYFTTWLLLMNFVIDWALALVILLILR